LSSDVLPDKQPTPGLPTQDYPGKLSRDFSKHKLDKTVAGGEDTQYYARQGKVGATHKQRSASRCISKYSLFCFTKGLGLKNATQELRTIYMQFLQY